MKTLHKIAKQASTNPREVAWSILQRLSPSQPIQAQFTKERVCALSSRDLGLATELAYGTVRALPRLSFLLTRLVPRPETLPPALHFLLYMALYECLFLDRIPHHATVHSAVNLAEERFGESLAKLTNATLRHFLRLGETPHCESYYTDILGNTTEAWATFYGLPLWIANIWTKAYGEAQAKILAKASGTSPWSTLRINAAREEWPILHASILAKTEGHAVGYAGIQYIPSKSPEFLRDYIKTGKVSQQGAGSQAVLTALSSGTWQSPLWDACAGHGGKTLALIEQGHTLLASDTNRQRLRGLRDDAKRLVLKAPPLFCASATKPALAKMLGNTMLPQTILLDAPCSGLGTLARHPDLRLSRQPEHLPPLVALQEKMLDAAWGELPVNGSLAYITCTVNPDENEVQIARFLSRQGDAGLKLEWQSTPDCYGTDLMYGALIVKG